MGRRPIGKVRPMSTTEPTDRHLDDVLDGLRFAMVSTSDTSGPGLARPLTLLEQDGTTLRFLVARSAEWVTPILAGGAPVQAAFADPSANSCVSVRGEGRAYQDREVIDRLWNPAAGAYFDGRDDPDIAVLELEVAEGEWWDGPSGKVGRAVSVVKAGLGIEGDQHGDVTA